jgi:hypothetical protein
MARVEQQRLAIEGRVRSIQERLAQGRSSLRDQLSGIGDAHPANLAGAPTPVPVNIGVVRHSASAALAGLVELQRAAIELAGAHQKCVRARAALVEASVAKKAVEMLEQKRRAAWMDRLKKREAAELDDLVTMRARRDEHGQMVEPS